MCIFYLYINFKCTIAIFENTTRTSKQQFSNFFFIFKFPNRCILKSLLIDHIKVYCRLDMITICAKISGPFGLVWSENLLY